MYLIDGLLTGAELKTQSEIDSLISVVASEEHRPVLRDTYNAAISAIEGTSTGLASSRLSSLMLEMLPGRRMGLNSIVGDLFFNSERCFIVQPHGKKLLVLELRAHATSSKLQQFCELVADSARSVLDGRRLRSMSWTWSDLPEGYLNRGIRYSRNRIPLQRANRGTLTVRPADYTENEAALSALLVRTDPRAYLLRLLQTGKARSKDASQGIEDSAASDFLAKGILRREFLLTCKKDSSTLCTIESMDELREVLGTKIRCSTCGRPFGEEQVQEIVAVEPMGKTLMEGSHWMTVWVTSLLVSSGVDKSHISWGATAGEDEIDIVVDVFGSRVFFELKDREFGLGDAYPFVSRVERYGAEFGVIVTMSSVAEEVKKFLGEQRSARIWTLEGEQSIADELPTIVSEVSRLLALRLASGAFSTNDYEIGPLLARWLATAKTR